MIKYSLTFLIRLWQKTRTLRYILFFPQCRFYPSCSDYFVMAIKYHGLVLGLYFSVKRLFKCHPFCEGGIDEIAGERNGF